MNSSDQFAGGVFSTRTLPSNSSGTRLGPAVLARDPPWSWRVRTARSAWVDVPSVAHWQRCARTSLAGCVCSPKPAPQQEPPFAAGCIRCTSRSSMVRWWGIGGALESLSLKSALTANEFRRVGMVSVIKHRSSTQGLPRRGLSPRCCWPKSASAHQVTPRLLGHWKRLAGARTAQLDRISQAKYY